jgi:hypothetical protein
MIALDGNWTCERHIGSATWLLPKASICVSNYSTQNVCNTMMILLLPKERMIKKKSIILAIGYPIITKKTLVPTHIGKKG